MSANLPIVATDVLSEAVDRGVGRLERSLQALFSTGAIGGVDISIGVFAMFLVLDLSGGNHLLAALAFSSGFVVLALAGSELFTENFLVPIVAVTAGRARWPSLLRLWAGTLVFNLIGGWLIMLLLMSAFPGLHEVAVETGGHFVELGIGWHSFSLAMLAGMVITLMTWMEQAGGAAVRIVAAVIAGFLLAAGQMNHSIVASHEMFAGMIVGAPYGYLDWLTMVGWAVLGNAVGGIGLVTVLRLVQAGGGEVTEAGE